MHVVFVTGEYPPQIGGIGDYTALLARHLMARQYQVSVVVCGGQTDALPRTGDAPCVVPVPRRWHRGTRQRIAELAGNGDAAWIHVQYQTAAFNMNPGINLAPRAWKRRGLRVAWTYHDLLPPYLFPRSGARMRHWITMRPGQDSDLVISTNRNDCHTLQTAGVAAALIPVASHIPRVPPDPRCRDRWGLSPAEPVIGFFGLAQRSKGLQTLVEAVRLLHYRHLPAKLLIIGGAPGVSDQSNHALRRSVQNLMRTADLESHVIWTGALPPAEVSHALAACDLVALPYADGASSRHSALVTCLEHECVTVTTQPQDPDLLAPGVPVVARQSFVALADKLAALLQSADLRATARAAARQSCAGRSWKVIATRHQELYQSHMAGTPHAF